MKSMALSQKKRNGSGIGGSMARNETAAKEGGGIGHGGSILNIRRRGIKRRRRNK